MIRRPPRSTRKESSAASDVYKRQSLNTALFICTSLRERMEVILLRTLGFLSEFRASAIFVTGPRCLSTSLVSSLGSLFALSITLRRFILLN
eukprot:TRINITY_DN3508_c0_g1_i1.p1 TRINITY_DN3508_c0_g1~~TRINITY_DN3508_c0_g1_i1.p1  ORF type:complete len:100 (+),score=28.91 TRINITY_DN3508_c0_g1_i1:25-300(+)